MKRTQTKQIHVGPVAIGGGAPVARASEVCVLHMDCTATGYIKTLNLCSLM